MKLAMFTTKEQYLGWLNERFEASMTALRMRREECERAVRGIGRKEFMEFNGIPEDAQDYVWARHIAWRVGSVKHAERQVKKIEREIRNAQ